MYSTALAAFKQAVCLCARACVCVGSKQSCRPEKRGINWPACCFDASLDRTVPCDASVCRDTEDLVFLGTGLWPLTALVSTTFTKQLKPLSRSHKANNFGVRNETKSKEFIDRAYQQRAVGSIKCAWCSLQLEQKHVQYMSVRSPERTPTQEGRTVVLWCNFPKNNKQQRFWQTSNKDEEGRRQP